MKKSLIIFLLVVGLATFNASAQQRSNVSKVSIELKQKGEKKVHRYELYSFDYYFSHDELMTSDSAEKTTVSVNIIWSDVADAYILNWVTTRNMQLDGRIVVEELGSGELIREVKFHNARVYSYNESFSTGSAYGYNPQMSLMVDRIEVKGKE